MDSQGRHLYFALFNEIGIIAQLSRAAFEARLPPGITVPHFSVLNHLVRLGDGRTPLAIARAFQAPKTSMTHTLAGLEARGLIAMRPNPKDKRSKCVWLTEQGRRFRDEAIGRLEPDLAALARQLPPERLADLVPRLAEIRAILDAARDEPA
ncbi:MAG: MarR family winged helix-turn-helix transcriptional regulator [Phenylobacterium sp.]|uniref:MarR family winged helix-turn-helix transcriptional regulator n=1 Tax=Phenylobacterium sp. TaxID=1871053 RepID=UPI0027334C75|nr:MarR family winged helix-turn-helix transcriptional regulator [Phenylobacterium sp.]MDP3746695.1 MarR family winged helix-turn-helix transcriptional regulator [Phenylobacterium sp.]